MFFFVPDFILDQLYVQDRDAILLLATLLCFALLLTKIWGVLESTLLCFAFFGVFWNSENTDFALLCFASGSKRVVSL